MKVFCLLFVDDKALSVLTVSSPDGPTLAGTRMSLFWILLELKDDGSGGDNWQAVRRAKLQSNRHHQQSNTQLFTGRCLSCRLVNGPIVSENYTHQVQQLHLDLCPFQSITWWEPFLQPCWTRVQSIKKSISVSRLLVTEEKCYRIPWTFSSQPHRVFQRCIWPLKVPDHIGEGCQASRQPCDATTPIKALSVNIIHSRVLGCNTTRPSIRPSVRSCVCVCDDYHSTR